MLPEIFSGIFSQILSMSVTASFVVVAVLLLRLLLHRAPKIFSYVLWAAVLFRLLCPMTLSLPLSAVPQELSSGAILDSWSDRYVGKNVIYNDNLPEYVDALAAGNGVLVSSQGGNYLVLADDGVSAPHTVANTLLPKLAALWLAGVCAILLYSVISLVRLKNRLVGAVLLRDNIYLADHIETPFVLGLVRPKIYLPSHLAESEQGYIIMHEQCHISRHDIWFKPLGFAALAVHWFNPLVWLAFSLAVQDMEMACDERVLRDMEAQGLTSDIRCDYSESLLRLASGSRAMPAPLAFGEGDCGKRIKNLLNYKKPALWLVVVAAVVVAAACVLLMGDKIGQAEQAAQTFPISVQEGLEAAYEEVFDNYLWRTAADSYADYNIQEGKILNLQKVYESDDLLDDKLEIWAIEYRLRPENPENVALAGGTELEGGWLTQQCSMGDPLLVLAVRDTGSPELLTVLYDGEVGSSAISLECALRESLEGLGLIQAPTYDSEHVIVEFKMSTGETAKLFLSQPAKQGELGIWCVERWMGGNGNVYLTQPDMSLLSVNKYAESAANSVMTTQEYYAALQEQSDENLYKSSGVPITDPTNVAIRFIKWLGQSMITLDDLTVIENAAYEQFCELPISTYFGYITKFGSDEFPNIMQLDQAEYLTVDKDSERLAELGFDTADLPNGYCIYNPQHWSYSLFLTDEYSVEGSDEPLSPEYTYVLNNYMREKYHYSEDVAWITTNSREEFADYLSSMKEEQPFWITAQGDYVTSIKQLDEDSVKGSYAVNGSLSLQSPISGVNLSDFVDTWSSEHTGLDIEAAAGTDILAALAGTVAEAGWSGADGNVVLLDHGNGWQTLYAHCSQVLVNVGDVVKQGQRIALVGSTGRSTGAHLHFELRAEAK
jgi:beta-lactamase regulating signal transducer with metallopeptidase domain/biotin carboxyl carrier protein